MPKQEKLKFDYDEYFNDKFESTAILMCNTRHQAFTFAFYLNQLYGLHLERHDDITLGDDKDGSRCLIYSYQSNADQLAYFLIENPGGNGGQRRNYFDKTLLIIGPDAHEVAQHIYDELDTPQNGDGMMPQRDEMMRTFVESGILESALFDFSDPDYPETTYFPDTKGNAALQKKRARFLKEQREYVSDLIFAIDPLLPDYDSE